MKRVHLLVLALLALSACASRPEYPLTQTSRKFSALDPSLAGEAPPVAAALTFDRIVRAREEPHNWLTYYGTYDGWRYSTLDQINVDNVAQLRPAWVFQYHQLGLLANPVTFAFEAAPLVVDGVMYVSGPNGYVWALDAGTGERFWEYQHQIPIDVALCCGNVNRGVAVAQGKVFLAAANAVLVALDAVTGRPVWTVPFGDVRAGESATLAPLVVKNLVVVGNSGAEYGVRGHLDAFDIATGRRVWRRYTIPRPGEPGSETWPQSPDGREPPGGGAWARGGGTAWITGTYDPELDLLYWGTGNPAPVFYGAGREGANLYSSSVIAVDPDDGSIRWHYQWTPHDVWDYDGVGESILIDDGDRRLLAHFDRNGYFFVIDRTNGTFVRAVPFARTTWADIHPQTGAVTVRRIPTTEGTHICPGPAGAKVWPHASYNPRTRLLYVPVIELCATFRASEEPFREGLPFMGSTFQNRDEESWGHVKAFDLEGREVWSWRGEEPMVASTLTTAGGLVFTGEPNGNFNAWDARTGAILWRYQTGSGIHSSPITYSVNGTQYVAVASGWGGWLEGFAPHSYGAPRGQSLFVFALP